MLQARTVVITWSRCARDERDARLFQQEAVDRVYEILGDPGDPVKYYVSCGIEAHSEPGEFPYHVHLGLHREKKAKAIKIGTRLDLRGHHPNLANHGKSYKDRFTALDYPTKEDDTPILNFDMGDIEDILNEDGAGGSGATAADSAYAEAYAAASYEDACEVMLQRAPRDWTLYRTQIEATFKKHFAPKFQRQYELAQFTESPVDWDLLPARASALFIGPPEIGKTAFALAHFDNPLFVTHMDKLRELNPACNDGIVFDEMGTSHLHHSAAVLLYDRDQARQIHVRYGIVEIPRGMPKIFCSNNRDDLFCKDYHSLTADCQLALTSRQVVFDFQSRLF